MPEETPDSLAEFDARPGQSLDEHLVGVACNSETLLADAGTTQYGDNWQTVGRVLAWTHDAGKLTQWFQEYLETGDRAVGPTHQHTYHGFVSALLAAHALYELDVAATTRKAGFYAVVKHHGVLPNVRDEDKEFDPSTAPRVEEQFEVVAEQLANIDATAPAAGEAILRTATGDVLGWSDVFVDDPGQYSPLIQSPSQPDEAFYETLLRAWSTLVCADKLDAAGISVPESTRRPLTEQLRTHVEQLPQGESSRTRRLNSLRSAAHSEAKETLRAAHASGDRLFLITLPTGFGKTLTGLRAAMELATETDGRVIYALPYTSIIDQVDTKVRSIFDVGPGNPEYTIHHHLADTWTRLNDIAEEERISDGSEALYAETWQSGLVLTTFVQLFESLAGPTNVQSMKLPAFQDSIIVVDEPQALSLRWWELIGRLADFLRREYDATIVMMTATQPDILKRVPDLPTPTSLTTQFDDCCAFIDDNPRVSFHLHESLTSYLDAPDVPPYPLADAVGTLLRDIASESDGEATGRAPTTLAVMNTVESAATVTEGLLEASAPIDGSPLHLASGLIEFYRSRNIDPTDDTARVGDQYLEYLAEYSGNEPTYLVATLTARLRPIDRSVLLEVLRRRLDEEAETPFDEVPLVTVSTQLIEAGVDISFDRLYRDFGPIPSLVQAAGRCNRNFTAEASTVTVWRLASANEGTQPPSQQIYGDRSLLRPARNALQELRHQVGAGARIPEATMISTGVSSYYDNLHDQRRTDTRTSQLVTAFDTAAGESLRAASLIDDQRETHEVAVLISAADRRYHTQYTRARDDQSWQAADSALDNLKYLFVSMPEERVERTKDEAFTAFDLASDEVRYAIRTGQGVEFR